jgi:hypothetical protein
LTVRDTLQVAKPMFHGIFPAFSRHSDSAWTTSR